MTRKLHHLSRRAFFGTSAAALSASAVAAAGVRNETIDRVEVFPLRYPTAGFFKFFAGPRGSTGRPAVIVKVTTNHGLVGWGQSVPVQTWSYETLESATVAIRDYFAPALVGHQVTDIAGAHQIMDRVIAPGFSTGMPLARAGIDLALHDLAGKLAGKSLCQLWGRPRGGPITLSWTVNVHTLDEVEPVMEAGRRRGYRHFNIKVAPDPRFDVALARAVRTSAPDAFLWADANGGYDEATALEVLPKLADAGVDVMEAPLRPNRIGGYQRLKRQGALPILMDEGVVSPVELREFIALGMLDGVAMKPARCGGLLPSKEQIEVVEQAGLVWLGSGLCDPDISLAAALGLYGAFGLEKPAALNGPQFLAADVLATPLKIENGQAEIPTKPGLGVEVDEQKLRELMQRSAVHEA